MAQHSKTVLSQSDPVSGVWPKPVVMDYRLRNITPRAQWGCQPLQENSVFSLEDSEFISVIGPRLVIFDEETSKSGGSYHYLSHPESKAIFAVAMSSNKKLIATSVKLGNLSHKATLLIFDIENYKSFPKRPKVISYENVETTSGPELYFTNICFSSDSVYIACRTNQLGVGILVYDWIRERITNRIPTKSILTQISFHPIKPSQICVTGNSNIFHFWHITPKSTHIAPINDLPKISLSYECHLWVNDESLIAGTDRGLIILVSGCDVKSQFQAFSCNSQGKIQARVSGFIMRNDTIVAYSDTGHVNLFHIERTERAGGRASRINLQHQAYMKLHDIENLYGMQFYHTVESSSHTVVVASALNIRIYDLKSEKRIKYEPLTGEYPFEEGKMGGGGEQSFNPFDGKKSGLQHQNSVSIQNTRQSVSVTHGNNTTTGGGLARRMSITNVQSILPDSTGAVTSTSTSTIPVLWPEKTLLIYHTNESCIQNLAMSTRVSSFLSVSTPDHTINIWDHSAISTIPNSINKSTLHIRMKDNPEEIPNSLDIHPSGHFVVSGCDDHMIEYAVLDNKLELIRKMPIKGAITGLKNEEPFVNTHPASLVKYSHGGHLLAAVTGRLVQIFHLYNLEYLSIERSGTPTRYMMMSDHSAVITDLAFSFDDCQIFTTSVDGSVHEWSTGGSTRDFDYVRKGFSATRIACSPKKTILACFDSEIDRKTAGTGRRFEMHGLHRQPSIRLRNNSGLIGSKNSFFSDAHDTPLAGTPGAVSPSPGSTRGSLVSPGTPGQTSTSTSMPLLNAMGLPVIPSTVPNTASQRSFIAIWEGHIGNNVTVIDMRIPVTAVTFGVWEGRAREEFCVLGLADGNLMIFHLPIPLISLAVANMFSTVKDGTFDTIRHTKRYSIGGKVIDQHHSHSLSISSHSTEGSNYNNNNNTNTNTINTNNYNNSSSNNNNNNYESMVIDESKCRIMSIHGGPVSRVLVSPNSLWILSGGYDGTLSMLSTSTRAGDVHESSEPLSEENNTILTNKSELKAQREQAEDKDAVLDESLREKDRVITSLLDTKKKQIEELEITKKREVEKRDKIIISERDDHIRKQNAYLLEMENLKKSHQKDYAELEMIYERRLAQETLYLQKIRQAYDEHVSHVRRDLQDVRKRAEALEFQLQNEKKGIVAETEKEREVLLQYCDYVRQRYQEIFSSLETLQDQERDRLHTEVLAKEEAAKKVREDAKAEVGELVHKMNVMRFESGTRDMEVLERVQELDRTKDRVQRLEAALQTAMGEVERKSELAGFWEARAGEQQQQISELERIRRTLTSQLHALREDIGPKEVKLVRTEERLVEVDREYAVSMEALSKKEYLLSQKDSKIMTLQKQLQTLKQKVSKSEHMMKAVTALFLDYKDALQRSSFNSKKITANQLNNLVQSATASALASATSFPNSNINPVTNITGTYDIWQDGVSMSGSAGGGGGGAKASESQESEGHPDTDLSSSVSSIGRSESRLGSPSALNAKAMKRLSIHPKNASGSEVEQHNMDSSHINNGKDGRKNSKLNAPLVLSRANSQRILTQDHLPNNNTATNTGNILSKKDKKNGGGAAGGGGSGLVATLQGLSGMVDLIVRTSDMETSFKKLSDHLSKFMTAAAADQDEESGDVAGDLLTGDEQQKHMKAMTALVSSLRTSVDQANTATEIRVAEKRVENEQLLHEINALRAEIHELKKDNQVLRAELITSDQSRKERIKNYKPGVTSADNFKPTAFSRLLNTEIEKMSTYSSESLSTIQDKQTVERLLNAPVSLFENSMTSPIDDEKGFSRDAASRPRNPVTGVTDSGKEKGFSGGVLRSAKSAQSADFGVKTKPKTGRTQEDGGDDGGVDLSKLTGSADMKIAQLMEMNSNMIRNRNSAATNNNNHSNNNNNHSHTDPSNSSSNNRNLMNSGSSRGLTPADILYAYETPDHISPAKRREAEDIVTLSNMTKRGNKVSTMGTVVQLDMSENKNTSSNDSRKGVNKRNTGRINPLLSASASAGKLADASSASASASNSASLPKLSNASLSKTTGPSVTITSFARAS